MKKFLTLALALVMALALAAPAMAFLGGGVADKTLEDYEFEFYLVEYEENDYFGGSDIIVTDLPATDRGYVTNEVVCAMVTMVVKEDAIPADDIDVTITGENVKWLNTDEPSIPSGTVVDKAEDEGFDVEDDEEYLFNFDGDDAWVLNSDGNEIFFGDDDDVTYRWLVFAKVTDDDAKLFLTVELDAAGGDSLVLDGDERTDAYVDRIVIDAGKQDFTVRAFTGNDEFVAVGGATVASEYIRGNAAKGPGSTIGDDVSLAAYGEANTGAYVFTSNLYNGDDVALVITYDANYRARAMMLWTTAQNYLVDRDGDLLPALANSELDWMTVATIANAPNTAAAGGLDDVDYFDADTYAELRDQVVDRPVTNDIVANAFLEDVLETFGLDPDGLANRMRPGDIASAATADEELVIPIEIQPWQAFVTIPDIEVVDPPKTGDAATLAGFVMIVLAAAGVVVFKKVRA